MIQATSQFFHFQISKNKTKTTTRVERYTSRDIDHFREFHYRSPKIFTYLLKYLVPRK